VVSGKTPGTTISPKAASVPSARRTRARVVATMERRFVEAKKKPRIPLDKVILVEGRAGYRLAVKAILRSPR
jgi:hypothetical protein